jgi:hypothetical protein
MWTARQQRLRPRSNQGGQSNRKRGLDNTLASMDRSKKSNKNNKKFEDLKTLPYPFHKNAKHMATECRKLQELVFMARVKPIITKMETTTLTLAFNSLRAESQ